MMVHSFTNDLYPFYTSLKNLLVPPQLVFGCAFPTQFIPLHKMFFFPSLQKDILQPAHILVAHLS